MVFYAPRINYSILVSTKEHTSIDNSNQYNAALSWSSVVGCKTCNSKTDVKILNSPEGKSNFAYAFEYGGTMMTDQFCLVYDPKSPTCVKDFSFFTYGTKIDSIAQDFPYLGLATSNPLNGPSYVTTLNETGRMLNVTVSYQLSDWGSHDNNNITFGGNVEGGFRGPLTPQPHPYHLSLVIQCELLRT